MSTQLRFDLDGLRRAIESGDAFYRTALYADGAELRIVDSDQPAAPPQILQGRSAIAAWIRSLYGSDDTHRVLESGVDGEQIRLVEERKTADGLRLVYSTAAEVDRGQIIRETATLTQRMTPANQAPCPPPHTPAPGPAVARHVPGYYLG